MRCFIGIPLDPKTREALARVGDAVRRADDAWRGERWVAEENLHITVTFLGDVPSGDVGPLSQAIETSLAGVLPFTLPFEALRAVPNHRRTRMLWASYSDPDGQAADVAARIAKACAERDITLEDRAFRAHVTLARRRVQRSTGERALRALDGQFPLVPPFVSVSEAILFESTLTKAGPVYDPLVSWEFPV